MEDQTLNQNIPVLLHQCILGNNVCFKNDKSDDTVESCEM